MWIYWKEQCKYCVNREKCGYEKKVQRYIDALSALEYLAVGVYGSTKFNCDYFVVDEAEYYKHNEHECTRQA